MLAVWKFTILLDDEVNVEMPYGAKLLHVASQYGDPAVLQLWALVEPTASPAKRQIYIRGTGQPISDLEAGLDYVGTVIVADGRLVWHVFDGGWI
jgi:hypothetical protein